ncbi:unnamed protein product [Darwinula stevensoni]|uniref:Cuticle protein CPCFC domain-containing protein n=1 Tax=Darwinula stevensoni TaxID=69355 RepID=A0A7R8XFW2_9CRUS|nr:unnamed protein product [Darwinula stevensoni]CAG0890912.1 unnamed protein product [Darwinula stevensoni]
MAAKILILVSLAVVGMASPPAARYPAGVNPAACPNYPYCDPLVDPTSGFLRTGYAPHAAYVHAAPAYRHFAPILHSNQYPAGVNPAACPNYPYCDTHNPLVKGKALHYPVHGAYALGYDAYALGHNAYAPAHSLRYPAGVDPHACPNYPYCH